MALKDFFKKLRKKSQKSAQQAYSKKKAAEAKTPKRAASSNYDRVRQKAQPKITKPSGSSGGSSYRSGGSSQSSWGSRQTGGTTQHRSSSQGSKSRPQATKKANQTSWQSYVNKTLKSQKSASQKSALNAYEKMAGNRTNALGTKSKVRTGGGVRTRDLSSEDYLKMNNAIRMGLHTTGDKKLDKRIGSRTAYSANRNTASRISTGFMQGLAPADVLEGGVGTYSKKARKAVDEAKKSTSFNIGYGAGQMAGFALGGTSGAAKSLVQGGAKAAAKAGAKSAGKKFAKNRAAEVAVETPMNIADAVKMARDEDGKVNKKKLAGYMALNTGLTAGAGAVMEGAAVKFTKKNADELIKLQAKANKGSITKEEGQKLTKLYDKLDKARKDTTAAKSNAAEEAYTKGRNMVSDARIERGKAKGAQRAENARQAKIEAQNAKVERAVEQAKESTQQAKNARINARVGSYVDEVNARNAQTLNDRDLVYRNMESINEGTFTDARGNTAPDVENIPTGKKANQNTAKSARKSTRETLSSKTENPRAYSKAETKEINDTVDRISNMLAHGDAADARAEAKALARKHGQVDKTFKTALDGADEYASALDKAKRAIYSRPWYMPDGAAKTLDEFYEVIGGRKNVGGYIHLRKNYRGNKDISSVDDVAKEFMDEYPELFPRDIVHSDGTVDEVKFFKSLGDIVQTKGDDIPRFREEDIPEDALEKIYDDLADDILKNAERNTDAMKDISSKDIQKRVRELSKVRQKYLEDMKAVMDDKSLSAAERFKKIDELNKDIAPTEEELFSLEGQLDDVLKREQKAKVKPKAEKKKNIGYHAGDLGKAESHGQQAGSYRHTGGYGTGTYFVGDEALIGKGTGYSNRPHHVVDFDGYNLYRPNGAKQGRRAHDNLIRLNRSSNDLSGMIRKMDITDEEIMSMRNAVYDLDYSPENLAELEKMSKNILSDGAMEDVERETRDILNSRTPKTDEEYRAKAEQDADKFASDMDNLGLDFSEAERREYIERHIKTAKEAEDVPKEQVRFNVLSDTLIKELDGDSGFGSTSFLEEVENAKRIIPELAEDLGKTEEEVRTAIEKAAKTIAGYTGNKYKLDSASTIIMKNLGFEGVDVRGIQGLDNTEVGSVIYELKNRDRYTTRYEDKLLKSAEEAKQKARNAKINKDVDESLRKLRERPGNFQEEPPAKEPARGDMPDLKGMSESELADDVKKYTKYLRNTENKYGADSPRAVEMREHLEEAKTRLDDIRHEKKTGQRTTRSDDPPAKQKGAEITLDEPRTRFGKAWRAFYRVMVDSEADIERFAKKIGGETGQNLLAGANAFRNARNIAGSWIQTATSTFNREQSGKCLDAIFKGLKGNKRADAIKYSYLVHNLDRTLPKKDADELIKLQGMVKNGDELTEEQTKRLETLKNKDKPIAGMPRTREETEQAIKELKGRYAPSEVKVFENFQQDVVKYADELLQYKVDAGVVSEAEAKRLRGAYKNYIPTFTNKEFSGVVHEAQNTGVSVSRGVKAAKGAGIEDELVDLYEQLAQATRSTIKHCEMNELLRTLGEAQGVKYADIDKTLSPDELLGNSLFISKQTGSNKKAFYYTADGKQHTVDLTDEMYMGLREMTGEEKAVLLNNPIVRKMAMPMKLFKGLITDWNIFFGVRNGARDLATALTYTKDVRGYIKAYPKAIKALTTHNDYYKAYIAAGGQFSSLVKEGGVDRTLKLLEEGKYSPLKWASDINGFIEMMPRMQEFISTIDKAGVPPAKAGRKVIDRAMRNANDVTLNFGRSGIVGKSLNVGAVPYLNPSIQGLDKIGRVFSEAKNEKNIRGLIGLGAKMSTFAIAPSVFNEWMLRNDEDYQQLNTRDKDNNYYIPLGVLTEKLGVKSDDDKGKFIKIPKARELVVAAEPFQYFYRHAQFGDSGGWKQMFKTGIDNVGVVNPLNENFISPVFRMANNKTWYGGNIESAYEVENLPTEDRYDESTSAIGIKLGQTKIAKELKLSPKKIDNLIDSYTGVIGDYMIPATAQASKGNPILNQFITDSVFSNKLSTETWEKYDELSQKANSKSLSAAEKQKAAYAKQDMYDKYINDAMILTRAVADVQGDKKLTKKEKGKYARDLRKYQNEIYRAANEGGEPTMNGKEVDPLKSIYKTFVTSEGTKAVDRAFKYSGKQYQEAYGEYKNILKGSTSSKESKAHDRKRFLDYCVDIRETQGKIGGSKDYVSYKTAAVVAAINKVSNKKQDAFGIYDDTRETAKTYSKVYDIDHYTHTEKTSFDASRKIGLEKQSEMQSHDIAMAQAQKKNDDGSYFIGDSRPEYQKGRMPAARYLVKTNKKQWTTKEIHDFADKYDFDYKSDYDAVYEQAKKTYKNYTDIECAAVAQVITNKGYNDFGDTAMEGDSGIMGGVYSGSGYGGRGRRRYGRRGYRRRGYGGYGGGGYGGSPSMDWNTYVGNIFTSQPEKPKAQAKEKVHDYTKKSELTEAYRRRAQNKQTIKNKKA